MRLCVDEDLVEILQKPLIGRFIGPHRKHPAGMKLRGESAQAVRLVERCIARVQQIVRGVINVQQHGVKPSAGVRSCPLVAAFQAM